MEKEKIIIRGTQEIAGMNFHDIEGGFGKDKKAILVKDIANIHNKEFKHINEAVNKNRKRFKNDIDIIDLKSVDLIDRDALNELGFSNSSISNAKNIYLLSERGYSKLLKIMDDDLAWEKYDELVDGYFNMREVINSNEHMKAELLLHIYKGGQSGILASRQLTDIEVEEATKPLIAENNRKDGLLRIAGDKTSIIDVWLDKDNIYAIDTVSKVLAIKGLGRNNFWKYLRENRIIKTDTYIDKKGKNCSGQHHYESFSSYCNDQQYFIHRTREISFGFKTIEQNIAFFTCKGVQWIIKRLQKDGYIKEKNLEDIVKELEQEISKIAS